MTLPLLILRPEPGASETAARARVRGLRMIVRPLFEIVAQDWTAPDPSAFDAVLMTSANAARTGGRGLAPFLSLPLYAVGERTAEAARAIGFADVRAGVGDAQAAVDRMAEDGVGRAFHPGGVDRTQVSSSMTVVPVAVYRSAPIEPPPRLEAGIALLHSARAARRLAEIAPDRAAMGIAAISASVLAAAGVGWRTSAIAAQPCDDALLAAGARLCQL